MITVPLPVIYRKVEIGDAPYQSIVRIESVDGSCCFDLACDPPCRVPCPRTAHFRALPHPPFGSSHTLLLKATLDHDELALSNDELLSTAPGYCLHVSGRTFIVKFMAQLPSPTRSRNYLIAVCREQDLLFRPHDTTIVGMLDVLGYSDMIECKQLQQLISEFRYVIRTGISCVPMFGGATVDKSDKGVTWKEEDHSCNLSVALDSVIVYVDRPTITPLFDICTAVALLMRWALGWKWLLRGGIAFGEFYGSPKEELYVGRGLLSAHELETSQDWSGVVLSHEVLRRFPLDAERLEANHLLVDYDYPLKKGYAYPPQGASKKTLNWFHYKSIHQPDTTSETLESLLKAAPEQVRHKVAATLEYFDWVDARGWAGTEPVIARARRFNGRIAL